MCKKNLKMSKSAAWSARNRADSPLLLSPQPSMIPIEESDALTSLQFPASTATSTSLQSVSQSSESTPGTATSSTQQPSAAGFPPMFSAPPQLHIHLPSSPTTTPPASLPPPNMMGVGGVGANTHSGINGGVVWKKGLYERQPFEDNYVDPVLFLQELKKNSNVKAYHYSDIVKDTFVIVQQISFIVVFVYMFALIVSDKVSLTTVFAIDGAILLGGAASFFLLRQEMTVTTVPLMSMLQYGQQALLFCSVVVMLSPVFQTLTVSYTDDTIWALGITSMFIHLLLTDYAYLNAVKAKYEQGVGVNAATFGSILLASRIQSPLYGAALVGFGILCFNLSPIPRHYLKSYSVMAHVGATFLLCGVTMGCLLQVPLLAALFAVCVIAICFVVPWCFVKLQARYKNQINGPWDEAKPQNSLAAAEWANAGLLS